jgi:hypothetical protein
MEQSLNRVSRQGEPVVSNFWEITPPMLESLVAILAHAPRSVPGKAQVTAITIASPPSKD